MKRTLALMLVAALAAMLIAPAAALSAPKGHGAGKGKGPSVSSNAGKGAGGVNRSSEASKHAEKAEAKAAKKEAKAEAKAAKQEAKQQLRGSEVESDTTEASETPDTDESSPTVEVPTKLTGIANALAHIQANLARMQAKVDAGLRASLPPGLVAVADKFMAWLGMTPPEPGTGEETTGTVEPTGTIEPTDTVLPTDTVVPTDTVDTGSGEGL